MRALVVGGAGYIASVVGRHGLSDPGRRVAPPGRRPPVLVASSGRIRAELGGAPEKPAVEDMVADAYEGMRAHRPRC